MLVVTTDEIHGWETHRVCGEVFGLTVRSRNPTGPAGGIQSFGGGDLSAMTKSLTDTRNEAMGRMIEAARARGGNAVVGMRFDPSDLGDGWTEICAYGTAVVAIPVSDAAKQTATLLGYGQPAPPPTHQPSQPGYPQGYAH
jgi:uncharacterized protein YbjQ (UPF0145 family)